MLKVTLCQFNPTVGDIEGNLRQILDAGNRAAAAGSDVVVFPELALTGYYPGDLLDESEFLARVRLARKQLCVATARFEKLHWVVGTPSDNNGHGKALYNSVVVLHRGEEVLRVDKQLLPTYNIFDERRHFEPGRDAAKVLRIGSTQIGFIVCEDGWNDDGSEYEHNPWQRLADAAPDLVLSINASPSHIGKRRQRQQVFANASRKHGFPILYVNQVGGQDTLVYDGASFAAHPTEGIVFEAERFTEAEHHLEFHPAQSTGSYGAFSGRDAQALAPVSGEGLGTLRFYHQQIVLGLVDYARRCGFKQAVIGCSGGIDSALTLALAVDALGAENVAAVTMPSKFSSTGSVTDSQALCDNLGVRLVEHPIGKLVAEYESGFSQSFGVPLRGLPLENLQARARGTILMEYSNHFGHLLLTTGNKSEISVGYCTLYGDTNGGLGLIGDLYKTEVFALAQHLNDDCGRERIPQSIIAKPPSAELAPDQKDTDSLPPYDLLDEILKHLIEGQRLAPKEAEVAERAVASLNTTEAGRALIQRVQRMIARNEYKRRQAPPIIRVRARAFGSGRQMPIAAKHYAST